MNTYSYLIKKYQNVNDSIDFSIFNNSENILIQVFSGSGYEKLQEIITKLKEKLPKSHIIGSTTDGEIIDSKIYCNENVISISVFNGTNIKSAYVDSDDAFKNGQDITKKLIKDNTKLLILFSDGTSTNGEDFLAGVESINKNITISGGMAGDNGKFIQTYVACNDKVLKRGAVGVSLNSDILKVNSDYSFDWIPIGLEHTIDKVEKNRVYSIDGMSCVDFYKKYIGDDLANSLPAIAIEFPLMIKRNGTLVARAVIKKYDDKSLVFTGNFTKGEKVSLGFGNAENILRNSAEKFHIIASKPVECFFIYACMARRRYLNTFMEVEMKLYSDIVKTVGFFTYAEFFHKDNKHLLMNQTLTVVSLSESENAIKICPLEKKEGSSDFHQTIQALTNIINRTQKDYVAQSDKLEKEKKYSQEILGVQKKYIKTVVHETNTLLSVMTHNIDLYDINHKKNKYMSNIEIAMKNMSALHNDLSYSIKKVHINYPKTGIDIVSYIKNRIDFFKPLSLEKQLTISLNSNFNKINLYFNEYKLERIIDNNLTNAIKYTYNDETIYIDINKIKNNCIISFTSHSPHIEDTEKIFIEYYRGIELSQGFGLGLSLVKGICDEENISMSVNSSLKQTSFTYSFDCVI